jgi:amino acid transporter
MENTPEKEPLERGLGLWQSTALNIANMVGIGPFITIPAFIATMGGPQAMIGWIVGAVLVICDGLVWSELGAALPGSGGTYHFLREIFGRYRWGRLIPFLFIWQFLVSGALEMASGYVGGLQYLHYAVPQLKTAADYYHVPGGTRWIAAACVLLVTLLLCRSIRTVGWLGIVLCSFTVVTVLIVIGCGLANFNADLLPPPPGAFTLSRQFTAGLGGAMLIAIYDYLGYYNVCHLGDEVRQPERTIPRAVMTSVAVVAFVYLVMNVSIIAVVPWQEAMKSENVAALFMEKLYGRPVAVAFTGLILVTSFACLFASLLGFSRIPYAAARQGDFFRIFAYVHPTGHYPLVSLAALGTLTAAFCFLDLTTIIEAAVCVRIVIQFIGQIVGLHLLRTTRPDVQLPFRMWLYPLPSLVALAGWIFVLVMAKPAALVISLIVLGTGLGVYALRSLFPLPPDQRRD